MSVPDFLTDPNAVLKDPVDWRHGKVPDYTVANRKFAAEATMKHPEDSLEFKVSCLVKNWEKEVSFKQRVEDFRTINPTCWTISINGGPCFDLPKILEVGTYSALIGDQSFFCSSKLGFKDSHETFRKAMPTGFAWEVLEVFSGVLVLRGARPPRVSFKWRHWGRMTGRLQCPLSNGMTLLAKPTMEEHGMSGCALAWLGADCRMEKLEVYFDQQQPMASMVRHRAPPANTADSSSATAPAPAPPPSAPRSLARNPSACRHQQQQQQLTSTGQPVRTGGLPPGGTAKAVPAPEASAVRGLARGMLGLFTPRGKGT